MTTDTTTDSNAPAEKTTSADAIRARRRWLLAFALLGLAAIASVAVVQIFAGNERDRKTDRELSGQTKPVALERFNLEPRSGKSRRGLAELIRREDRTYLRMIAAGLRPNVGDDFYQASLVKRGDEKVLGSQKVDTNGIFLGQTKMEAELLHSYDRIELRLVGSDQSESGRLILSGVIPN